MYESRGQEHVQGASRPGLGVAVAAAVLLGGLVAVILLATSSGSSDESAAAPRDCLEAWNSDPQAIAFGGHNSTSHGYSEVQVGYMPREGSVSLSADSGGNECAVVFAANQLDSERLAAGQIHLEGQWVPLSELLESADLAALQSDAVGGANAIVTPQGNLVETEP